MRRLVFAAALAFALALAWLAWRGADGAGLPSAAPSSVAEAGTAPAAIGDGGGAADGTARRAVEVVDPGLAANGANGAPARQASTAALGRLRVRVVSAETGNAIAAVRVTAGEVEGVTGAAGEAELELAAGRYVLGATPPSSELIEGGGWIEVIAGETRDVRIELRGTRVLPFWGRLVTRAERRPLSGVRLRLGHGRHAGAGIGSAGAGRVSAGDGLVTAADGTFFVHADRIDGYVEVVGEGLAPTLVATVPGHEVSERALEVPVSVAAELFVQLRDAARRPLDGEVALTATSVEITQPTGLYRGEFARRFAALADARGVAHLPGLPPDVALHVAITRRGYRVSAPAATWVLVPGRNDRDVEIARGYAVRGRVVEPNGAAVPGVEVAVVERRAGDGAGDGAADALPWVRLPRQRERLRTGADGEFAIPDVPAGAWWVGVVPEPRATGDAASAVCSSACAAVAVVDQDVSVDITAHRGLAIAGVARDPADRPVADLAIVARRLLRSAAVTARTAPDGAFRLGPLLPGDYAIDVEADYEAALGLAAPVPARAGDRDVVLRLAVVAGAVRGRAIDAASGAALSPWVCARARHGYQVVATRTDLDGRFRYPGLRPGTWDLVAHDAAGRAALAETTVIAGAEVDVGALALERGGAIVLRHPPAEREVSFAVERDGRVLFDDPLASGGAPGSVRLTVVPGTWTVRILTEGVETLRRVVDVGAGSEVAIDVGAMVPR